MSFSSEVKNSIASIVVKRLCCKKLLLYGMMFSGYDYNNNFIKLSTDNERLSLLYHAMIKSVLGKEISLKKSSRISRSGKESFVYSLIVFDNSDLSFLLDFIQEELRTGIIPNCEGCVPCFFRGLFLSCGTITNPKSEYHLEFFLPDFEKAKYVSDLFEENGFTPKLIKRKKIYSVYFKGSESIEDFFTYIGSSSTALSIMNEKIMKDIRNNENRRNNCETSNISKTVDASFAQVKMINYLKENDKYSLLSDDLKETAELRIAYPEESVNNLALLHNPPISKSGVYHRLKKIEYIYELIFEKE